MSELDMPLLPALARLWTAAEAEAAALPTPIHDALRAEFDGDPVLPCIEHWAGRRGHIHACRHPHGHPGRHVCECRSWTG